MTAHKIVIIECDKCGTTALPETMIVKDVIHIEGGAPDGVVDARHLAARKGWIHGANGNDLCPACGPATRAPVKSGGLLAHLPHPRFHRS
jgi:hypothetical protein